MEKKKLVFRDGHGAEVNPVDYVGSLWMNNTLPSIALDALAQFTLINALANAGGEYTRKELPAKDIDMLGQATGMEFAGVSMARAYVKDIDVQDLMNVDYWYGSVMDGCAGGSIPRAMLDETLFGLLDLILSNGRVVERSMRAAMTTNPAPGVATLLLHLTWLEVAS